MACYAGFLAGREAARLMLPHGRGAIFFTGATASLRGGVGYAAFAAAKAGLRAVAQSAARELGPKNIHVAHLVIDAGVDTAWVRERIRAREGDEALRNLDPGRLMRPDSVAEALLAALSAAARCVDVRDGDPSVRREVVTAMRNVEFHFDFGSPNAYLSHLVIPDIERRTGREVRLCAGAARRRVQADQQPLAGGKPGRHQEQAGVPAAGDGAFHAAATASRASRPIRSSRSTRW